MDEDDNPVQCGHCNLILNSDSDYDASFHFFLHHQRAHPECPDWSAIESVRRMKVDDGRAIRVGDPPPMRILLQN